MDYSRIYNQLIAAARMQPPTGYTETHHVIPRCMGGLNEPSNLVQLTAKQHFVAHHLLFKIHGGLRLAHAWFNMCRVGRGQDCRLVNARLFERARTTRAQLMSEESKGSKNHFYGKTHSAESRARMSQKQRELKLWENRSDVHKRNLRDAQRRPKTDEHKSKIGRKGMLMLQHVVTKEIIRVRKNDARLLDDNWVNPRKLNPEPRRKCDHCDVVTTSSNLKRWHNDNCKHKGKTYYENQIDHPSGQETSV